MVFTASSRFPPLPFEVPSDISISQFILEDRWGRQPIAKSRPMYTCGLTGTSYTVDDINLRTEAIAAALGHVMSWSPNKGSEKDKVVAIYSYNSLDTASVMWATHRLSGIVTPVGFNAVAPELGSQLKQTAAKVIFTCHPLLPIAISAANIAGIPLEHIFLLGVGSPAAVSATNGPSPFTTVEALVQQGSSLLPLEPLRWRKDQGASQIAFVCFSSGTSGQPKGVKISHRNVIANTMQIAASERAQRTPGATESALCALPMSHIYALVVICHGCVYRGDEVIVLPKYDLLEMLRAITVHQIRTLFLVPPILLDCIRNEKQLGNYDLACAANIMTGTASFSAKAWAAIQRLFPNGVLRQGYGLTEVSGVISTTPRFDILDGSSGLLLPGTEFKVVGEDGVEITGLDQAGELWVKTPSLALGYLDNDEATRETFIDGWMRTGDKGLFRLSHGGIEHVFLIDRIKELIKVKGMQVAPAELEAHILEQPDVVDAAVIAVDDDRSGELPKAFVVKRTGSALTDDDLVQRIHESFRINKSRYKWLRGGIEVLEVIPKSPSGKILRRVLKDKEKEARRSRHQASKL